MSRLWLGADGLIFGSDGEGDEPSLIIDGVRIPFQMEAHVSYGPAEGGGDDDWPN